MDGPDNPTLHETRRSLGRFALLAEKVGEKPRGFDHFVWNKMGQPQAGPVARKRGGVGSKDGPDNPTLTVRAPIRFCLTASRPSQKSSNPTHFFAQSPHIRHAPNDPPIQVSHD
jgi:hypothetical protein